jgi:hypothetical protein
VISRQRHAQRLHQFLYMSLYSASLNRRWAGSLMVSLEY